MRVLELFSCRRSTLSSPKSITSYRRFCCGAVSSPVIVCVNDRPFICNVSAYASDCGRLLISSFTVVKHVLLLVELFWPPVELRLPSRPGPKRLESGCNFSGLSDVFLQSLGATAFGLSWRTGDARPAPGQDLGLGRAALPGRRGAACLQLA